MQSSEETYVAPDGVRVHVRRFRPDNGAAERGIVHLAHGMAEHGGRYARLAQALTERGLTVVAHDHRGHGKTASPEDLGHMGDEGGFEAAVGDLRSLILRSLLEAPKRPVVLIGHSMGSFMAQRVLFDLSEHVTAAVLSASTGKPTLLATAARGIARAERARLGPRGKSRLLQSLSFETFNKAFAPNRTADDWLSRDEAEVDAYVGDPLCGFECSTSTWVALVDAMAVNAAPHRQARLRKDLPVFAISGSEDPVNERGAGLVRLVEAYRAAGLSRVEQRIYDGARHELFNDTNREEVTRDVVEWLEGVLGG